MTVSVTPDTFRFVHFDSELVRRVGDDLVAVLGIDRPVRVDIDETTPLGRMTIDIGDEISIHVESGAFEDTKRPRHQSEAITAISLGRCLLKARDRLDGGFGEAPPDNQLSLRQVAAWDTYCAGRLSRLGLESNEQRWKYNFRNRLGFTDATDEAFERIWASDSLTWGELEGMCPAP